MLSSFVGKGVAHKHMHVRHLPYTMTVAGVVEATSGQRLGSSSSVATMRARSRLLGPNYKQGANSGLAGPTRAAQTPTIGAANYILVSEHRSRAAASHRPERVQGEFMGQSKPCQHRD